jgi:tRNA pseudouridine55 synthase
MDKTTSGFLVVDKPGNMTSAAVVAKIKKMTRVHKIGHTGTLDPFATGVLVCCINKATRLADFLLKGNKTYQALLCLGISTDTQDATGAVVHRADGNVFFPDDRLKTVFDRFKGKITQMPPVYSALKFKGVPLYKWARAGKAVQKPARSIEIEDIHITHVDLPHVGFEVTCSGGTYIRSLCADIGASLGSGGHLKELRRTASGFFSIDQALTLGDIEKQTIVGTWADHLVPMTVVLGDTPMFSASGVIVEKIRNGVRLTLNDLFLEHVKPDPGRIAVVDEHNNLIAILHHEKDSPHFSYGCVLIS